MGHSEYDPSVKGRKPWNAGRKLGAKRALKPQQVWAIRFWLDREQRVRDRAMFDLAVDSKLRGCDIVSIKVEDVAPRGYTVDRATIRQRKTGRPVRFEITEHTRQTVDNLLTASQSAADHYPFRGNGATAI